MMGCVIINAVLLQRDVSTVDNIDYVSTVVEFAKKKLLLLLKLIVEAEGGSDGHLQKA